MDVVKIRFGNTLKLIELNVLKSDNIGREKTRGNVSLAMKLPISCQ